MFCIYLNCFNLKREGIGEREWRQGGQTGMGKEFGKMRKIKSMKG
jgi:hypothetical protein